jgi:diguanylate cyclase (GGDEF)-like protein/PAS domain S-box-containing protein
MSMERVVDLAEGAAVTAERSKPRVLVVEDSDHLRLLSRRVLEASGWDVADAATAGECLQTIEAVDPDVVLLDLGLPDADGDSVLAELKRSERTAWVPVVVLSGRSDGAEVSRLLLCGAQDYLVKPFVPAELHARLVAARRVAVEHRRLAASERELRLLLDNTTDLVIRCGLDGVIRYISPSAFTLLGWRPEEVVGRPVAEFCHPDDVMPAVALTAARRGETVTVTRRALRADGSYLWVESAARLVPDPSGSDMEIQSSARDVTHRLAATAALAQSERRWRNAFDSAPVPMAEVDLEGRYLKVNGALCELFGYRQEDLVGTSVLSICHHEESDEIGGMIKQMVSGEINRVRVERRFMHANGLAVWVAVSVAPVTGEGGRVSHMLTHYLDITARKRFELELEELVDHDPLTGLLNRRGFDVKLDRHVAHVEQCGPVGALLVIDLDHFKQVNDTHGHQAGDELIVSVADTLRAAVRDTDVVARLGGDEFAVILPHATVHEAQVVAARFVRSVRQQAMVLLGAEARGTTASVGIAMFDDPAATGDDMIAHADRSMYEAKEAGRDRYALFAGRPSRSGLQRHQT